MSKHTDKKDGMASGAGNRTLAVEVRDLSVRFGDFYAVKKVSFAVERGEIFGFLGANGAGKTTTIRVLCGLLLPTEGFARVAGLGFEDGDYAIKSKVGYMSQKFTLYNDLTVEENLDFAASLRKLDPADYRKRRTELFELISFDRKLSSKVTDLPSGVKQQVSLAASLLHDPEIVFLDEPTAGVSPAYRARFWTLIRKSRERKDGFRYDTLHGRGRAMRANRPDAHRRTDRTRHAGGAEEDVLPAPNVRVRAQGDASLFGDRKAQESSSLLLFRALWTSLSCFDPIGGRMGARARRVRKGFSDPPNRADARGRFY